jgi:hypothetical protein
MVKRPKAPSRREARPARWLVEDLLGGDQLPLESD